jgi:hypothetical protein
MWVQVSPITATQAGIEPGRRVSGYTGSCANKGREVSVDDPLWSQWVLKQPCCRVAAQLMEWLLVCVQALQPCICLWVVSALSSDRFLLHGFEQVS